MTLPELAEGALEAMRDALSLEVAALYVPPSDARPVLERLAVAGGDGRRPLERLVFDDEAWRFAVQGDSPLVMRDRGAWLIEHPFSPPADDWLVLPLGTGADRLGAVIGASAAPLAVGATAGAVLRLLGDLLAAGITAARLRQESGAHRARARTDPARGRGPRRARAGPVAGDPRAGAARLLTRAGGRRGEPGRGCTRRSAGRTRSSGRG